MLLRGRNVPAGGPSTVESGTVCGKDSGKGRPREEWALGQGASSAGPGGCFDGGEWSSEMPELSVYISVQWMSQFHGRKGGLTLQPDSKDRL